MSGHDGRHSRRRHAFSAGAVALCALLTLFIAAPSTWGAGVVDQSGKVVQTHAASSLSAPRTLSPSSGSHLQAAAHTIVMAVLVTLLGVAVIGCTRRREPIADAQGPSPVLHWVQRRGPPRMA
jgi:hypothetical protein